MNQRFRLIITVLGASFAIVGSLPSASATATPSTSSKSMTNQVFVGADLHTISVLGNRIFVTGHEGAGMSDNGGSNWTPMSSLKGTDVMSWTTFSKTILAGGHNGLFKSTNNGASFKRVKFYGSTSDVHAIGASGKYVYLASPQVGLLMSTDGGTTWKMRNAKVGRSFMGSMLVDPKNPKRIIAPDMSAGLAISTDGGLTWSSLGGPAGPMAVAWNSQNMKDIVAIGMANSGISTDGGKTWKEIRLPSGATAIVYSTDGKKLIVGVLIGNKAQIYTSINRGKSWQTSTATIPAKKVAAMDPNMPGMDHVKLASSNRPLALTLGTFGFGTSSVFVTAVLLRRKDRAKLAVKESLLASRGAGK